MLVSIIIPVYNAQSFIKESLISVLEQTYKEIEIIVIDDSSTDNSVSIIKQFPVKLIQQPNKGACAARNRGFQESKGHYIQFLDADDLLSQKKIEVQLKQLQSQEDMISNGYWGRFYTNDPLSENINWGPHKSLQMDLDPISWLCQNHMSTSHAWLTPRNLIEKAGLWDESLSINQDGEFFTRVIAQSRQVLYCPEAKVYYRSSLKGSISSKAKEDRAIVSKFRSYKSFESVLLNLEYSERTRLACANKYQSFVHDVYPRRMDLVKVAEKRIMELGGSNWPTYPAGKIAELSNKYLGWKTTAWLKYLTGR